MYEHINLVQRYKLILKNNQKKVIFFNDTASNLHSDRLSILISLSDRGKHKNGKMIYNKLSTVSKSSQKFLLDL